MGRGKADDHGIRSREHGLLLRKDHETGGIVPGEIDPSGQDLQVIQLCCPFAGNGSLGDIPALHYLLRCHRRVAGGL